MPRRRTLARRQLIVGIDNERVVDALVLAQPRKRVRAVIGEVPPWLIVHFSRQPHADQPFPDDSLRAVGRTRVLDQHVIDDGTNALQASQDHFGFVFHNHAEADRLHASLPVNVDLVRAPHRSRSEIAVVG